jgi:hypothetical protein
MSVAGVITLITILVGALIFARVKQGAFFKPRIKADFPEDLKPFLKMNKCKYLATAYPRHTLLPILKAIRKAKEEDAAKVNIDLMSYKFDYEGYSPEEEWYKTLREIIKKGGNVNLLGGKLSGEALENVRSLGANIRFLTEPPIAHLFIYSHESKPAFIWFEGDHRDDRAKCVVYTNTPSENDAKMARDYFNNLWEKGTSIENTQA